MSYEYFGPRGNLYHCSHCVQYHEPHYTCEPLKAEQEAERDRPMHEKLERDYTEMLLLESIRSLDESGEAVIFESSVEGSAVEQKRRSMRAKVKIDFTTSLKDPEINQEPDLLKKTDILSRRWLEITQTLVQQEGTSPYQSIKEEVGFFAGITATALNKDPKWIYTGFKEGFIFREKESDSLKEQLDKIKGTNEDYTLNREKITKSVQAETSRQVGIYKKGLTGTNHDVFTEILGMQLGYKLAIKKEQIGKQR